jgi:hypothetical protein
MPDRGRGDHSSEMYLSPMARAKSARAPERRPVSAEPRSDWGGPANAATGDRMGAPGEVNSERHVQFKFHARLINTLELAGKRGERTSASSSLRPRRKSMTKGTINPSKRLSDRRQGKRGLHVCEFDLARLPPNGLKVSSEI